MWIKVHFKKSVNDDNEVFCSYRCGSYSPFIIKYEDQFMDVKFNFYLKEQWKKILKLYVHLYVDANLFFFF